MNAPIYLDHAASTPLAPEVLAVMQTVLSESGEFGNPSSVTHAYGRAAAARVALARGQLARLLGAQPDELVFTSGATESNNLAIQGVARAQRASPGHIVKIYRWFLPLLELDLHSKLVQYIKLAEQEVGLGSEIVRAPRLPLIGEEHERILSIIRNGIEHRPNI